MDVPSVGYVATQLGESFVPRSRLAGRGRPPSRWAPPVGIGLSLVLLILVIQDPVTHGASSAHAVNFVFLGMSLAVSLAVGVARTLAFAGFLTATSRESKRQAMRLMDWLSFVPFAGIAGYLAVRLVFG